ncbi:MAG: hypothetical protein HYZ27_08940, partial [Deltaproteobacteria bacterium]|nr:hypothetical protein [Deltaproteobacteria bacterium]
MAETHGTTSDPLAVYDELRLAGQAPDVQDFCARFPDHPTLADRIAALHRLQHDLRRLAEPQPSHEAHVAPAGFTLLATLGAGGMGSVYLALQHSPRRLCALKFVHHATSDAYTRFVREADLAARLIDPGIAAVFAFGDAGGRAYLATEYVHGFSLRSLLATADLVAPQSGVTWLVEALRHLSAG